VLQEESRSSKSLKTFSICCEKSNTNTKYFYSISQPKIIIGLFIDGII